MLSASRVLLIIAYYRLLLPTITYYYLLLSPIIAYYRLLSPIIAYYRLLSRTASTAFNSFSRQAEYSNYYETY